MMYLMMMTRFVFSFLVERKNLACREHKKSADETHEHEETENEKHIQGQKYEIDAYLG